MWSRGSDDVDNHDHCLYQDMVDEEDMKAIKELETGIRKIIPVTKLSNGEVVIRDKESKLFPFDFEETYPN